MFLLKKTDFQRQVAAMIYLTLGVHLNFQGNVTEKLLNHLAIANSIEVLLSGKPDVIEFRFVIFSRVFSNLAEYINEKKIISVIL